MTDRELLELAAKAAGIVYDINDIYVSPVDGQIHGIAVPTGKSPISHRTWQPLYDDGDALRLAVKLKLNLSVGFFDAAIMVGYTPNTNQCDQVVVPVDTDPYAATRRAIVRVAAQIGRAMP
jgi:hypothetical protein